MNNPKGRILRPIVELYAEEMQSELDQFQQAEYEKFSKQDSILLPIDCTGEPVTTDKHEFVRFSGDGITRHSRFRPARRPGRVASGYVCKRAYA